MNTTTAQTAWQQAVATVVAARAVAAEATAAHIAAVAAADAHPAGTVTTEHYEAILAVHPLMLARFDAVDAANAAASVARKIKSDDEIATRAAVKAHDALPLPTTPGAADKAIAEYDELLEAENVAYRTKMTFCRWIV